jgi:hypothetical protein
MATSTIELGYYLNMFGFFSISGFDRASIWTVLAALKMCDL